MRILGAKFFGKAAPRVARDLIGKVLVRRIGTKIVFGVITETEAYEGFQDKASHARRGKTPRNFPMFGPAGRWYVYFVYGNHWMLNVVTGRSGYPSAVLIRGVFVPSLRAPLFPSLRAKRSNLVHGRISFRTSDVQTLNGPGRLTKFFKISKRFNNLPATPKTGLWIAAALSLRGAKRRGNLTKFKVKSSPRVGVSYAGPFWSRRKWRFYLVK